MPSSSPQPAQARRALIEDIQQDKKGWMQHGLAALAISVLGLGIAGSVMLTGAAQNTERQHHPAQSSTQDSQRTSRDSSRAALDPARVKSLADQRAEELDKLDESVGDVATDQAVKARDKALRSASASMKREAELLSKGQAATSGSTAGIDASQVDSSGKNCLPVVSGYSIAARFGQVGTWARYHTGFDFSAPVGTPLHAPAAGVVTNAGIGPASGWAGNYVTIKYADGTQVLLAHMSTVSVSTGQTVSACQAVGAIGMTGRTFGPHVHFEVYPAGVEPGDVYRAVDPMGWLNAHGLKP